MQSWLLSVLVLLIVLAVIAYIALVTPTRKSAGKLPYRKREYLLTKAERRFYDILNQSIEPTVNVFPKVRLADLLYIESGTSNRLAHWNRIQSKHLDFVLCTKSTLSPVLAIELDDSSHEREDREERDIFVDEALRSANLPLLRVRARSSYQVNDLVQQIKNTTSKDLHS